MFKPSYVASHFSSIIFVVSTPFIQFSILLTISFL
nr:MAG TPA: hypothetical protein [Caudoviricetes sp.]